MKRNKIMNVAFAFMVGLSTLCPPASMAFAQADSQSVTPVEQTDSQDMFVYTPEYPQEASDPVEAVDIGAAEAEARPAELNLEFRILEVNAVDMTNPECGNLFGGPDEISLGGTSMIRYGVDKINFADLGKFCEGDTRNYHARPWVFKTFNLQDFPHTVNVTFIMVERDNRGGKEAFLNKFAEENRSKVQQEVERNLDPTTPTAAAFEGSDPGRLETTLKTVLRETVKAIIREIIQAILDWLVSVVKGTPDDIFTPETVALTVESANMRWPGGATTSPRSEVLLREETGTYRIIYDWRIVTPPSANATMAQSADVAQAGEYTNWGTTPWWQTALTFPPLFWTKPGTIQNANAMNLVATHSNKCLDVTDESTSNGALLQQRACSDVTFKSQLYSIRPIGYFYQIVASHSNKCLEVTDNSLANGANIVQSSCATSATKNQLWIARPVGNSFQFIAAHSGKCLDVRDVAMANGAKIQQWECIGFKQANQLWRIGVPAKPAVPTLRKVYLPLVQR
jgi:hypothetical protein